MTKKNGKRDTPIGRPRKMVRKPTPPPVKGAPILEPPPEDLPPAPEPTLTPREEKLAMLYAEGDKSLSECCRRAGFKPDSQRLRERVRSGDISQVVARRMRELGLTLDVPLVKIRDFYDAKKEVLTHGEDGPSVVELRDNDSQRWAVEQTLKLHGAYPTNDAGPTGTGPAAVNIIFAQPQHQTSPLGVRIITVQPGEHGGNGHNGHD